ncbi:group 1 truncated hemoglobin [Aquabacterium sp.]|uniref:group I truncated hemoglobin n=1 Tax=Aquabacterium sp. TaxID=1872578 RepID=UPI00378393EB
MSARTPSSPGHALPCWKRARQWRAALTLCALHAVLLGALPGPAHAEPSPALQAFGGPSGLQQLSSEFVDRLKADARLAPFFKDSNPRNLKKQLADQFCVVLEGPCVYDGETMKNSHADLKIGRKDFNALVEVLQQAMDARGVPFAAQNQLLARLAPMHRDVITVH